MSVNEYFNYNVPSVLLIMVRIKPSPHLLSCNLCGQQVFFQSANDDYVCRKRKQRNGFRFGVLGFGF